MLRQLHSLPGLIAALLVMLLAISGAVLSVDPALERLQRTSMAAGQLNVGQLAGRVASHFPGVEQIQRTASGRSSSTTTRTVRPGLKRLTHCPARASRLTSNPPSHAG